MPSSLPPMPPLTPARSLCHGVFLSSLCTVPSLLLFSLLFLFYFFHPHHHLLHPASRSSCGTEEELAPSPTENRLWNTHEGPEHFRKLFLSKTCDGHHAANDSVSAHLRALTIGPHLAGTASSAPAAEYVLFQLRRFGVRVFHRDYRVLLSYPSSASLFLVDYPGGEKTIRKLDLSEVEGQSAAVNERIVAPYHAYSPSGSVTARPVYVNHGRDEDYRRLAALGVDVRGCVAVVRRGGGYRGAVVHRAAERGAAAVLIFGEEDSGGTAPRGGVERGTVLLRGPGDPLTPGWAADAGGVGERLTQEDESVRRRFPTIPSMPISMATAQDILAAMDGPSMPKEWHPRPHSGGGVGGVGTMLLNFTYEGKKMLATIRNIFGVIPGREEPDRYVILGNHRDAWTYGAVDPNSGTAALLEVARRFGILQSEGWRPRRTIVLCSWDAEEFGMIGSTEWVEDYFQVLSSKAVAYLNVDCAVQGSGLFASATPQLDKILVDVTKQVKDPDMDYMTVYEMLTATNGKTNIERLGRADSDFTSFLHHAGIPSLDMYFGRDYPTYHTIFDSYNWVKEYADPFFHRHVAVAEIWGLLALHLADDTILPFDYLSYASQLLEHVQAISSLLDGVVSMQSINTSIQEFIASANKVQKEQELHGQKLTDGSVDGSVELTVRDLNDRLMLAERSFLDSEGLDGRRWYKHTIYGPPEDEESKLSYFPGIVDAMSRAERGHDANMEQEVWRIARAIRRAAVTLGGGLG